MGSPAEDAKRLVDDAGLYWEDVSDDTKPVTANIWMGRIRVRIVDGVVIEARNG